MPSHARKRVGGEVKRIPEPHRKNLELLLSANLQIALTLANAALIMLVMALLAFYQIPGTWGLAVFLTLTGIVIFLAMPVIYLSVEKYKKIFKKLGGEESFKKYVEHDPE